MQIMPNNTIPIYGQRRGEEAKGVGREYTDAFITEQMSRVSGNKGSSASSVQKRSPDDVQGDMASKSVGSSQRMKDKSADVDSITSKSTVVNGTAWNDESFAKAIDFSEEIDTTKTINWGADGNHELTQQQIEVLKGKYDVNNLTEQEQYDLMSDLTHMNAISPEDMMNIVIPPRNDMFTKTITLDNGMTLSAGYLTRVSDLDTMPRLPLSLNDPFNEIDSILNHLWERSQYHADSYRMIMSGAMEFQVSDDSLITAAYIKNSNTQFHSEQANFSGTMYELFNQLA